KAIQADAVNTAKAEGLIADITEEWEKLDILINNAGITRDNLILRMSEEEWDQVIDTNLKSVFNYSKAVAKPMMRNSGGSIVNISSDVCISGNAGQRISATSNAVVVDFSQAQSTDMT